MTDIKLNGDSFTKVEHPVLKYPWRSSLDIVEHLKPFIENKVVCDIGCACGDLLYELKNFCEDVIGVENNEYYLENLKNFNINRDFIVWDNIFNIEIPKAEVYFLWLNGNLKINERVISKIPSDSIIIDSTSKINMFKDYKNLELLGVYNYELDETKYFDYRFLGSNFKPKDVRTFRVYKKI